MTKYKPRYKDLSKVSNNMTPTGRTSRELVSMQESEQRKVAEKLEWMLAKNLNSVGGKYTHGDSKLELENLGFKVLEEVDDLFYSVNAPKGWKKETEGYWTTIKDDKGNTIITQFYKGAFYDRDAFLNIKDSE